MEIQDTLLDGIGRGPPSPDFSDLLAGLVADDTTDDGMRTTTDGARAPQHGKSSMDTMDATTCTDGGLTALLVHRQPQSTGLQQSALGGMAQLGPLPADLHLALLLKQDLAPQAVNSAPGGPTAASPAQLAFSPGLLPTAPGPTAGSLRHGSNSAAAGSRRGRRAMPRLTDLQQQLDSLTEQFQVLSQENTFLRGKLKLLERVLPYRDSHIGFLAAIKNGQPLPGATPYFPQAAPADAAYQPPASAAAPAVLPAATSLTITAASSGSLSSSCADMSAARSPGLGPPRLDGAVPASAADSHQVALRPATATGGMSGHASAGHGPLQPTGRACGAAPEAGSWSTTAPTHLPGTPVVLALCPGPDDDVPVITPAAVEELRRVTARDFQLLYKHFVMQLSVLGMAAEVHGPSSPQHARLERFLDRIFVYMDQVVLLSPECFVQSMYVNVETGQQERPSEEFWYALGCGLQLTPQQLEEVRMCSAVHAASVAPVAQERVKLASELSATISAAVGQQVVSSGDVMKTLSEVDEVAERLRRNVIKEHQAQMDIGDFLCMSVLSPIQVARCMAASYPYIPDGVAILHACDPANKPKVHNAAMGTS